MTARAPRPAPGSDRGIAGRRAPSRVEELARFVCRSRWEDDLRAGARAAASCGCSTRSACALGALDGEPVAMVRAQVREFGGAPLATLIGVGQERARSRRALQRRARPLPGLQRLLPGARRDVSPKRQPRAGARRGRVRARRRAHAADRARGRLPGPEPPVRGGAGARQGLRPHHQGAYAVAAGVARALGLDERQTANAIAIAGTSLNALRVTRTGELSHWKGLAYPGRRVRRDAGGVPGDARGHRVRARCSRATRASSRRSRGRLRSTGRARTSSRCGARSSSATTPRSTRSRRSRRCSSCAPNTICTRREVQRIELDTFQVAYDIIGGGEEGEKQSHQPPRRRPITRCPTCSRSRCWTARCCPSSTCRSGSLADDVQELLRRVAVRPDPELSRRFPAEHSARVRLHLRDGRTLEREQHDYDGFHTRPMSWDAVAAKFDRLAAGARRARTARPDSPTRSKTSTSCTSTS